MAFLAWLCLLQALPLPWRMIDALKPRGRFLFTASVQAVAWADLMTGHQSVSLGDEIYRRALTNAGLSVLDEYIELT